MISEFIVDRLYKEAREDFASILDNVAAHKLIWIHFIQGDFNPAAIEKSSSEYYRVGSGRSGDIHIDLPVPPGIGENDIEPLVKAYLRDGFKFRGVSK